MSPPATFLPPPAAPRSGGSLAPIVPRPASSLAALGRRAPAPGSPVAAGPGDVTGLHRPPAPAATGSTGSTDSAAPPAPARADRRLVTMLATAALVLLSGVAS